MRIEYGSLFYCLYPSIFLLLLFALWMLLRKRSRRAKNAAVLAVAFLNLAQHLLKSVLYPHLWGSGFALSSTAYNVCAYLILLSPFVWFCRKQALRDFVCVCGCCAGFLTMLFPIWFLGQPAFSWEIGRFYLCHGLLLVSSALPLLLQTHQISWKSWKYFTPLFLLMLIVVLLDNILCVYLGLTPGATPETLHQALLQQNSLWMMGPRSTDSPLIRLLLRLTPDVLAREGHYVPVLWYAWSLFLPMSFLSLAGFSLMDLKRFRSDLQARRSAARHKENKT